MEEFDESFMREALAEAAKASALGEVPVGAVLTHNNKVIARAHNLVESLADATAHAEMLCLKKGPKSWATGACWRRPYTVLWSLVQCARGR